MNRYDEILMRYRWLIGLSLVLIILSGSGFLFWQNYQSNRDKENAQVLDLKNQNEALRAQLSGQSKEVAGAETSVQSETDKININAAMATELDKLPSIGPVYAAAIVAYREDKGAFQSIEEIKNVKGIGDKTFEKLKDLITVGN